MNLGVIAIQQEIIFTQGEEQFWEAFISQISGKFEREYLRNMAKQAFLLNESDKLYKTLFNSISHELRIPIAAIMGSSETLLEQQLPESIQKELYSEINIASIRLNRLVENLLNMSRLESGRITPHPDWMPGETSEEYLFQWCFVPEYITVGEINGVGDPFN